MDKKTSLKTSFYANQSDLFEVPTLWTERLVLRAINWDCDPHRLAEAFADSDTIKWLPRTAVPQEVNAATAQQWLVDQGHDAKGQAAWVWAIAAKHKPDRAVGFIVLRRDPDKGNRTFLLHPDSRGLGYMTEAVQRIEQFAFIDLADDDLAFEELCVRNALDNTASTNLKVAPYRLIGQEEREYCGGRGMSVLRSITRKAWLEWYQDQQRPSTTSPRLSTLSMA
jgi:RimJ/RimL family protein N-acetyltransferase